MVRCNKCGKIYVGSYCPFCKKPSNINNNKLTLERLGWDDRDKLYYDPEKNKKTNVIVHGTYVNGDMKVIHGDELSQNAKKIEARDSVVISKSYNEKKEQQLRTCPYCGKNFNFPNSPRFCPYCEKQISK